MVAVKVSSTDKEMGNVVDDVWGSYLGSTLVVIDLAEENAVE